MVTVVLDDRYDLPKVRLMELLAADDIDSRPFFFPLTSIPAYASFGGETAWRAQNPVAYRLSAQGVNLPSALNLTAAEVHRVCEALKGHLARFKTRS